MCSKANIRKEHSINVHGKALQLIFSQIFVAIVLLLLDRRLIFHLDLDLRGFLTSLSFTHSSASLNFK